MPKKALKRKASNSAIQLARSHNDSFDRIILPQSIVSELAKGGIEYLSLPRLLRLAITKHVIDREEATKLVGLIECEERTIIKRRKEIFSNE